MYKLHFLNIINDISWFSLLIVLIRVRDERDFGLETETETRVVSRPGWGGMVEHVTTMSNSNASCFELSCVSLCFDNITYLSRSGIFLNILRCSFQYNSICELVVNFLSGTELAEKSGNNETYCFVIANKSFGA